MDDKTLNLLLDHFFDHEKDSALEKVSTYKCKNSDDHPFEELANRLINEDGSINTKVFNGLSDVVNFKQRTPRSSPRIELKAKAIIIKHNNRWRRPIKAKLIKLSTGGVALFCRSNKLKVDDIVSLEVLGNRDLPNFQTTCRVKFSDSCTARFGVKVFGLEFLRVSLRARKLIKGLVTVHQDQSYMPPPLK